VLCTDSEQSKDDCTVMMTWEIVINLLHHQFSLSCDTPREEKHC
jgi:hypothetical protein